MVATLTFQMRSRAFTPLRQLRSSARFGEKGSIRRELSASPFFSEEHPTFSSLGIQSPVLLERLSNSEPKLIRPSAVQASSFTAIRDGSDVIVGAETGSGKTLAYLLPLLDDVLQNRGSYDYCRAIVLVPNKELCYQVVRAACLLGGEDALAWPRGDGAPPLREGAIRLGILPGGLRSPEDFKPFRDGLSGEAPPLDLVVATPATLAPLGLSPKNVDFFSDVPTLVVDEADMLLEGGYSRPLQHVLMGFRRADKLATSSGDGFGGKKTQHVFVAATLPNAGLKSTDAFLAFKYPRATRITMEGLHDARHYGLAQRTLWLEMDAVSDRLDYVLDLFAGEGPEDLPLNKEKVMIFLNTVDDVDGATNALRRSGINAVPYHAKIKADERASNLALFRDHDPLSHPTKPPVLVCTDAASRGLDVPGVTVVVQLQFASNVVAHLHRMGRCGRAGKTDGRGIVFYSPGETELVEVVKAAENQRGNVVLGGGDVEEIDLDGGKVDSAFSRKRGFTKKRKKERRDRRLDGDH